MPHGAWLIPASLLAFTVLLWLTSHSAGRGAVVPSYEPPAGLRPGEAGVIIDGVVHAEDIVAAVVDLAARGYVTLTREPDARGITVRVQQGWILDPEIRPWEAVLLANVFSERGLDTTTLATLRTPLASASIRDALSQELAERRLFAQPPIALRRILRGGAVIVTAVWMQLAWNVGPELSVVLAGLATGAVLWVLAGVIAAGGLTAEGRRARQRLRGFREYLVRVEKPRLEQLPHGALDAQLPWAIALGVTEGWLGRA